MLCLAPRLKSYRLVLVLVPVSVLEQLNRHRNMEPSNTY